MLCQVNGKSMDANDDKGKPPFPLLSELSETEIEYVSGWLDYYLRKYLHSCFDFFYQNKFVYLLYLYDMR